MQVCKKVKQHEIRVEISTVIIGPLCFVLCRHSDADLLVDGEDDRYKYAPLILQDAVLVKSFLLIWMFLACLPIGMFMMWKCFQRTMYTCHIIASVCCHYDRDLLSYSVPLTHQLYHMTATA